MGTPYHYGLELPARCMTLITALLPMSRAVGSSSLGGLSTTFVLAMSTPMIVIPIERIWQPRDGDPDHYNDERQAHPDFAAKFDVEMKNAQLGMMPFYEPGAWRLAKAPYEKGKNLTDAFRKHLSRDLREEASLDAATKMQPTMWASCLRNSLSHGGVLYLDDQGHQAEGRETTMLAFVSGKYDREGKTKRLVELRALRISVKDYVSFLQRWAGWLGEIGLSFKEAA